MYDGYLRLKTVVDTKDFSAQIDEIESQLATLQRAFETTNDMPVYDGKDEDLRNIGIEIEKVSNKLVDLKSKQQAVDTQGFENVNNSINNIGNGMTKVIKKVTKWGLAVFGVRAVYGAIRRAVGIITEYDEQMNANLDYIKYALAKSIKPLIEWIINGVYKILSYVNYIANAWFGINLFENSGVSDYTKEMKKANDETKKLNKQLMSIDEANVFSDSKEKTSSVMPSMDLSKVNQIEVPGWVKWIADNKDTLIELAGIVGIAFGTAKTLELLGNIGKIFGIGGVAGKIGGTGLAGLFTSLASIVAIAGSIAIIAYIAKSTWDDINKLKGEISEINKNVGEQNQNWKKSLNPATDLQKLSDTMNTNLKAGKDSLKDSNKWLNNIFGLNKSNLETVQQVVKNSDASLDKLIEMYNYEGRTKEEKKQILDLLKQQYGYNQEAIAALEQEGWDTKELKKITQDYANVIAGVEQGYNNVDKNVQKTIDSGKQANIEVGKTKTLLDQINVKKIDDKTFRIAGVLDVNTSQLDAALDRILASIAGVSILGMKIPTTPIKNMINMYRKQIGLASGGIVNMPGKGVPLSNVVTGEAGREGVIPLTDPKAMSMLGQEIGKWVNINNIINNYMDAKKINTVLEASKNQENMLTNGG